MSKSFKNLKLAIWSLFAIWSLLFVICGPMNAYAFIGPSTGQTPGTGSGLLEIDANRNIGFGTDESTPTYDWEGGSGPLGHGYVFTVASTSNPGLSLVNLSYHTRYLFSVRGSMLDLFRGSSDYGGGGTVFRVLPDRAVVINPEGFGWPSSNTEAMFMVGGGIISSTTITGVSFSGSGVNLTSIDPQNFIAGSAFASGNYAVPGSFAIGTSTVVGLPANGLYVGGRVGIGTISPGTGTTYAETKLHVKGSSSLGTAMTIENTGSSALLGTELLLKTDSSSRGKGIVMYDTQSKNTWGIGVPYSGSNKFQIGYVSDYTTQGTFQETETLRGSANDALLTILSTGKVGIATTTPNYTLDVAGDINLSGTLYQSGSELQTGGYWEPTGSDIYYNSGNVGIGTTTPQTALDVNGTTTIRGQLDMKGNKIINLGTTEGNSDAATKSYVDSVVGGGVPSGTDGQTLYNSAGDWVASDNIYVASTTGYVGIGTTSPGSILHISGVDATLTIDASSANADLHFKEVGVSKWNLGYAPANDTLGFYKYTSPAGSVLTLGDDGDVAIVNELTVSGTGNSSIAGNVGIATTTPQYGLSVVGTGYFSQPVIVGTPTDNSHAATKSYVDSAAGGGVPSGTDGQTLYNSAGDWVASDNIYVASTTGNVGIGTASPNYELDVNGKIYASGNFKWNDTNYAIAIGTETGAVTLTHNTLIGRKAGQSTTQNALTAIGSQAGKNNEGQYTTVVGMAAGYGNTGGSLTAVGRNAGNINTGTMSSFLGYEAGMNNSGAGSVGLGYRALKDNTKVYSTGIGYYAGYQNTGDYVFGLGYYAGANNSGDRVVGIGLSAVNNNSGNDVVAIGYEAGKDNIVANQFIVQQANINTVPLIQGDFSTGKIGIATTTPQYDLSVIGAGYFSQPVIVGTPTGDSHATTKSYVDSASGGGVPSGTDGQTLYNSVGSWVASDNIYVASTTGYVGIGTTGPLGVLDVLGSNATIRIRASANDTGTLGLIFSHSVTAPTTYQKAAIFVTPAGTQYGRSNMYFALDSVESGNVEVSDARVTILNTGNVGIATTTPQYGLSVVGTGYFSQPIIVGAPTGDSHAATKSYVDSSVAAATSTQYWTQSGSNLYPDNMGWSVGIGTSTPATALHVVGSTTISGNLEIGGVITGGSYAGTISAGNVEAGSFGSNTGEGNYSFPAALAVGTTTLAGLPANGLYVDGKVGIGTATPIRPLDVYGYARIGQSIKTPYRTLDVSGHINFNTVEPPTATETAAIVLTEGTGGTLLAGKYYYYILYYTADGDTDGASYASSPNITVSANAKVTLSNIPISNEPRVVGRKVYRTDTDGAYHMSYEIASITNNVDTTFVDTGYDLSSKWLYRKSDETGGKLYVDNAPALVVSGYNTGLGVNSLSVVTAYGNTAIGANAGKVITSGTVNVFVGDSAGASMIGGSANVAIGVNTMSQITAGNNNIAIGSDTLRQPSAVTSQDNIGIGTTALYGTLTGNYRNVAVGVNAGKYAQGYGNTFLGYRAGYNAAANDIGDYNIVLGYSSGLTMGTGSNNILIGTEVELISPDSSSQLNIGNVIYATGLGTGSAPSATGKVGIATTTPQYGLSVVGTGYFSQPVIVGAPTGDSHATTKSYVDSAAGGGVPSGTDGQTLYNSAGDWVASDNIYVASTTGNVGIGTDSPGTYDKLDIQGYQNTGIGVSLSLRNTAAGSNSFAIYRMNVGSGNEGGMFFGGKTAIDSFGIVNGITFRAGTNVQDIGFSVGDTVTGAGSVGMILKSSGKVGIATTTPQYGLSVVGTGYFSQPVIVGAPTGDSHAATKSYVDSSVAAATSTQYWTQSDSSLYPDNMSWSVGIGTSTPQTALHVIGSTTISGNLEIGGVITGGSYAGTISAGNVEAGSFGSNTGEGNYSFPAALAVGTTTLAGLPANGLYVDGRVGIGTMSPSANLHVLQGSSGATVDSMADTFLVEGSDNSGISILVPDVNTANLIFGSPSDSAGAVFNWNHDLGLMTVGTLNGAGTLKLVSGNGASALFIEADGDIGMGTDTPTTGLTVGAGVGAQFVEIDSAVASQGGFKISKAGSDEWLLYQNSNSNDLTLYDYDGGGGQMVTFQSGGNVGIGTSTPQYGLSVVGTGYFSQPVIVGAPTGDSHAATKSYVDSSVAAATSTQYWTQSGSNLYPDDMSWSIGIGTTTPVTALHVIGSTTISGNLDIGGVITGGSYAGTISAGNVEAGSFGSNTGEGNYSFPAALAVGTTTLVGLPAGGLYVDGAIEANGVLSFSDLGGGTVIDANGGDIVGVDKLTVATIDPIYEINGTNYATYAASFAGGVKEEYSGKARITKDKYEYYKYVIDFNKIKEGSDLWVWFKAIDFNKDNVEVVATAKDAPAVIWYEIEENKIVFNAQYLERPASPTLLVSNNTYSNEGPESIEFSYRLIGKRFDWRKHPTKIIMNGKPLLVIP